MVYLFYFILFYCILSTVIVSLVVDGAGICLDYFLAFIRVCEDSLTVTHLKASTVYNSNNSNNGLE